MFGREFERYTEDADEEPAPAAPTQKGAKEDLTKFNAKKGKAAAKTVKAKYQWQILNSVGIPLQEIHLFSDPQYWSVPLILPTLERQLNVQPGSSISLPNAKRTWPILAAGSIGGGNL
jgi:hypothetical protein